MKWISVKDKLPEDEDEYLVCTDNGYIYMTYFLSFCNEFVGSWEVAYWMKLPGAPNEN